MRVAGLGSSGHISISFLSNKVWTDRRSDWCSVLSPDDLGQDVYGDGEHDGAVTLRGDVVEGLEVAKLERCRAV